MIHLEQYLLGGLIARVEVAKLIFPYMASIGAAYFVTLCLYPGIVSEIISCKFESWMPVILMTVFNASDLLGKVLPIQIIIQIIYLNLLCFLYCI